MAAGGRSATKTIIPGDFALSVGLPDQALPDGWRWVKLTDIARLESGHTPSRRHPEYWDGDIPWISLRDARANDGRTILNTRQTVTNRGLENSAARLLPEGTVCLSRTASVGYAMVLGQDMATSQDFVNWVCSDELEPRYLMYLLLAERRALKTRFAKGTTHNTVYYPEVKAFHVGLPPITEQRRLAVRVDRIIGQIAYLKVRLNQATALIDQYRMAGQAAEVLGIHREPSVKGWPTAELGDLGTLHCGQSPSRSDVNTDGLGVPYVSGPEQWNGQTIEITKWTEAPRKVVPAGCIFVTVKGAGVGTVFPGIAAAIGRDIYAFQPGDAINNSFARLALENTVNEMKHQAAGDIPGLTKKQIMGQSVVVPPIDEQRKAVGVVDTLLKNVHRFDGLLHEAGSQIQDLEQAVLARAFQGRLG